MLENNNYLKNYMLRFKKLIIKIYNTASDHFFLLDLIFAGEILMYQLKIRDNSFYAKIPKQLCT